MGRIFRITQPSGLRKNIYVCEIGISQAINSDHALRVHTAATQAIANIE